MVQFFQGSRDPRDEAVGKLSEALGMNIHDKLNTFFANRSLESVQKDKSLENAPISKRLEAAYKAVSPYGEIGQKLFQQKLQMYQQEQQEAEQDVLARVMSGEDVSPSDLKKVRSENLLKLKEVQQRQKFGKNVYDNLLDSGYPEETAKLWQSQVENSTVGGLSDTIKQVNDLIRRSQKGKGTKIKDTEENADSSLNEYSDEDLKDIIATQDEGLTASERVKRESERFKVGQPIREEAATKIRNFARDKERLGILESLHNSKKLPKDFGLLNVDKEGNLRLPFAASPEAQRFVKTLNEFSANAKDTFGSRVTNFDLVQYLKRFPTLLNSEEGKKQILEQMKIVNDINSVYYKNLQDIFHKAGGARKIDSDVAEDLADRKSEKQIDELVKKFDDIGKITTLPSASEFKGKKIRNIDTGEIVVSDGENWVPVQ